MMQHQPSSYEVLTDDQKKAMSDDEVDKWNTKIKDSTSPQKIVPLIVLFRH